MKINAKLVEKDVYALPDGRVIRRDFNGKTPNGNPMAGRWTLKTIDGNLLDFDRSINDLSERHNINLYTKENRDFLAELNKKPV